ncbi:carbonic anhydrase [Aerococcaceae bacterium WGS1372]
MKNIIKAVKEFKANEYKNNINLYQSLSEMQEPHTLFIGCSDSRVSPERLLQAYPGEIFHIRNIANIVPAHGQSVKYASTTSAIEYAVEVLNVKNIVVCGHSNCGGCAASVNPPENIHQLPYTSIWISQLEELRDTINKQFPNATSQEKARTLEKMNVVEQINNLKTYDNIKRRYESGSLTLNGWHYNIGDGVISIFDEEKNEFFEI